jgi:hypothetical protein
MSSYGLGGLGLNSDFVHRARLFPLPYLEQYCKPPSRSARVRYKYRVKQHINRVTNRCIFTLNRLYVGMAAPPPPSSSFSSCVSPPCFPLRQPDNSTPSSVLCSSDPVSSSVLPGPHAAPMSVGQSRLLGHIRDQCATFVFGVRSTSLPSDTILSVDSLLSSFSFASPPKKSSSFSCLPSQFNSDSVFVDVEGPLPLCAWSDLDTLPASSSFSSSSTTVVPLLAGRVALPDSLNVVPLLRVLPVDVGRSYAAPSPSLLRPEHEVSALNIVHPLRSARVAGSRRQYVKLVQRMLKCGMTSFTSAPKAVNGVFAVAKDADSDRLIIDAQPANRLFVDSPYVNLPDPSHLVQLHVPKGARMFVGKSDLSNYYHHLGLPEWMRPYFCLPPLTPAELKELGLPPGAAYPMCITLPMGFSHAVYLANTSHEHIGYSSGAIRPEDNLLRLSSPVVSSSYVIHGIEIDDFFFFSLSYDLALALFDRMLAAYRDAGFVVKQSKCVSPTSDPVKVIGFTMCGRTSAVALSSDALVDLLSSTLSVLQRGVLTGIGLAHIVGRWTWCMLCRRPTLSVLQHVYRFIEVAHRRRFTLWPSVRRELWMLVGLLPLMHFRLSNPFFDRCLASDASELAAGLVCTPLAPMDDVMWPMCSTRSHAPLQALINAHPELLLHSTQQQNSSMVDAWTGSCSAYTHFYDVICSARWSTIISKAWRSAEHINALELRTVLLAAHWLLSLPSSHFSRVYLLVDSMVAFFALWKGRCSSGSLLQIVRKISALLLAGGLFLLVGWVPSGVNPADAPSRFI